MVSAPQLGTAQVIRADARNLPLADNSVDLVVTSPPYFALRSYQDGGEHYAGQIGSEPTPAEFVDALLEVTRECVRVLKPSGSLWVNLGDKYAGSNGQPGGAGSSTLVGTTSHTRGMTASKKPATGAPAKSLIGIPWRYALRCIDDLGLILRAEVIWSKPNGLPESVTDRVRRSHEQWFHFTLEPRYFSAVDEIREEHAPAGLARRAYAFNVNDAQRAGNNPVLNGAGERPANPLGKLPGSVWTVKEEEWDHVLSGPMHFCPRCGRDLTAGPSPATTTQTDTPPSTSQESASGELPDSSTKSSSAPSLTDSPSTTSVETRDASTRATSSPSPSKRTCDDETKPTAATAAQPDTGTTSETHTSETTASASAACVCETGLPPIANGSVWVVPTEPLRVPDHLGIDHFAAFPSEWPRRIIQGWSPAGVCVECGEGRRPVSVAEHERPAGGWKPERDADGGANRPVGLARPTSQVRITGYACACLAPDKIGHNHGLARGLRAKGVCPGCDTLQDAEKRRGSPTADTTPAVVLDPFGGTGTTALVAKALGRHGISVDMSADYCRLAEWRTNDRDQLAKVLGIEKAEQQPDDQMSMLDLLDGGAA